MKRILVCFIAYMVIAFPYKVVSADECKPNLDEARVAAFIKKQYKRIDFTGRERLSEFAFEQAYRGYINLRNAGKLNTDKDIISICDFNLPSTENRLWIIDLSKGKVLFNTFVAHGQGSGEDCAESFSNNFDSHQSSLGFYVTTDTYSGDHGLSLHLVGMDIGFNDAAMERGIVIHGADYVCNEFICANDRLGRSWGCPAVPDKLKTQIINTIEGGTCLFIYYPDNKFQKTSYWLNKKIGQLPDMDMYNALKIPQAKPKCTKYVIQYMHGNVLDSVKTVPVTDK
jgi:hypothetical protein